MKYTSSRVWVFMVILMYFLLLVPVLVQQIEGSTSINTLYAHAETTTIDGVNYYLHKLSSANGPATTLSASAASTGRKLMGRRVYPLSGIVSIPASTWTVTYRAMKSSSASSVVAHCDVDILIRKADGTVRSTIATNIANSPTISLVNTWQILTGTYNWAAYTVVGQTDYLEVVYYIEVTTAQTSKSVRLLVDDATLPLADQTKIQNVIFTYPNQAPVASFTYSPAEPRAETIVTFNASASYDPDGNIVSYQWDFGDDNVTTVANPIITHVYENCGNRTVTLTVTDNEGMPSSTSQTIMVINPSLLRLWADVGSYVGSHPDAWIHESWVVSSDMPAGGSVNFNLYIDAISNPCGADPTYDVYLAVAVNDTAQVASITIGSTTITTFTYGAVTWPGVAGSGTLLTHGVYPTSYALAPFGDVASNHGYYTTPGNPYGPYWAFRAYIPVTITASSTMNAGFKVHFDAQGVLVKGSTKPGYRNSNPFSHDLTSEGSLYIPPIVEYYLTVKTDPEGIVPIPGEGWYNNCTYVDLTAPLFVPDEAGVGGQRYRFTSWTVDGDFVPGNPITVHMNANHTAVAHYVNQYELIMSTNFGTTSPSVGSHWYDEGSEVSIQAFSPSVIDGERYVWLGWTGTGTISYSGMDNPASVTMNSPITQPAAWRHEYRLTMATNHGTTSPSVGDHWYEAGSIVSISAAPPSTIDGERYVWNGWTGTGTISYTGMNNPATVTMNGPISETALWTHQFLLTIKTSGLPSAYPTKVYLGGSQVGTASDPSPYTKWFDAGAFTGSIGVDSTVLGATGTQYVFVKWVEDSYPNNLRASEVMDSPKTFTAEYKTQYKVSFIQTGSAVAPTVTYTADTYPTETVPFDVWVKAGSQITYAYQDIVPGPTGVRYVLTGVSPPSPQTVNSPLTVSGSYKTQYLLTVLINPAGLSPQPTRDPAGEAGPANSWWYDAPTNVELTAQPVTGYNFDHWDVDGTSEPGNPITVTMNTKHTATAQYTPIIMYTLTIITTTGGTTTPLPGAYTYPAGSVVQVRAIPDASYSFDHWELDGRDVGSANPYSVLMDKDHTLKAFFSHKVGGRSTSINAFQFLTPWLSVISLLAAAVMLKGIIVKKKRS